MHDTNNRPPSAPDPGSSTRNMIVRGNSRITLLTDRMLRLEWSANERFEDRATLKVCNRRMAPVQHTVSARGPGIVIRTNRLTLTCRDTRSRFSSQNLSIRYAVGARTPTWHFGDKDRGNLGGTMVSLDGMEGDGKVNEDGSRTKRRLSPGLLSRNGCTFIDDTDGCIVDIGSGGVPCLLKRPDGEHQDGYFIACGHDYVSTLRDAAQIFGVQPLPPAYAFGNWYSKYWPYATSNVMEIVDTYERSGIPLSVFVLDMDWHKPGWVGYSWDRDYVSAPRAFLTELHKRNIRVNLNLHPAEAVGPHEDRFAQFCASIGASPSSGDQAFNPVDPKYMAAYFQHLLAPNEAIGVDGWWVDKGPDAHAGFNGKDMLLWLNLLHWEHLRRTGSRPFFFSRYGGLGNGRYPMGFSGDTVSHWKTLAWQVYFTATAANALFGYWSHDIGGFFEGETNPERYARWIQFGAFSPVLRTHTNNNPVTERRVFEFGGECGNAMHEALRLRNEIFPYVYTECRACENAGVSLLRPMYYAWPEKEEAYRATHQYMFGANLLVAPVTAPASPKTDMADIDMWLPDGDWFDLSRHEMVPGPRHVKRSYLIGEIPVFARAGAVIPGRADKGAIATGFSNHLIVTVVPGERGDYQLYEDDGVTFEYQDRAHAVIPIAQKTTARKTVVTIGPSQGEFRDWPAHREVTIRLPGMAPPRSVNCGGRILPWCAEGRKNCWSIDPSTCTATVHVAQIDLRRTTVIRIVRNQSIPQRDALGLRGIITRLHHVRGLLTDAVQQDHFYALPRTAARLAHTIERIAMDPDSFRAEVRLLRSGIGNLADDIAQFRRAYRKKKPGNSDGHARLAKTEMIVRGIGK